MKNPALIRFGVIAAIFMIVIIVFSNKIFLTIEPGEKGVIFKPFGGGLDKEHVYSQGFHIIAPWNTMYIYSVREQQIEESMNVLSSDGLNISTDVTVRFHPAYNDLGKLHDEFGEQYVKQLVVPEARSAVREVIGRYTPEELYSTKREEVETGITIALTKELGDNYVNLRALLIRSVELPIPIQEAIQKKLQQEQASQEYEFKLEIAEKEAERQRIQAEGRAKANDIISASLTDKILREKGIEATLELAKSEGSKTVIIGAGDEGLPLILGNQ